MGVSRLGVFGGTFDPIHNGHLFIAEEAADRLDLDSVEFIPSRTPPHRAQEPAASPVNRLEMVRAAIAHNGRFTASDAELVREGPSYTVDTLRGLRSERPDAEIYFIVGMDSLHDMPNWREPAEILSLAFIVAVERGGHEQRGLDVLERLLPMARGRVTLISGLGLEISATEVRQRLAESRSVRYLVPDPVIDYIASHGLYRKKA